MSDISKFLARMSAAYQGTHEERALSTVLFDDRVTLELGDQRLNSLAALTYNFTQCNNIFNLLLRSLDPHEFPWRTLHKAVLVYHTILLFGSDIAVDKCIRNSRSIYLLQSYNSATQAKGMFLQSSGGTDYGGPVRAAASALLRALESDATIRRARAEARQGQDSLVPMGVAPPPSTAIDDDGDLLGLGMTKPPADLTFGQGVNKSIGAGFDLSAVPGMYEGRPERYFDNTKDPRRGTVVTGDHQFTREAMNPNSLLDLAFGDDGNAVDNNHLPEAQYLPALEKQKELEALLRQQQEQLQRLQQLQLQQQPSFGSMPPLATAPPSAANDLLGLGADVGMPVAPAGAPPPVPPMAPGDFIGMGGASAIGGGGVAGMAYPGMIGHPPPQQGGGAAMAGGFAGAPQSYPPMQPQQMGTFGTAGPMGGNYAGAPGAVLGPGSGAVPFGAAASGGVGGGMMSMPATSSGSHVAAAYPYYGQMPPQQPSQYQHQQLQQQPFMQQPQPQFPLQQPYPGVAYPMTMPTQLPQQQPPYGGAYAGQRPQGSW